MSAARGSVSSGAGTSGHRTFRSLYLILYFLRGAKRVARQITFRPPAAWQPKRGCSLDSTDCVSESRAIFELKAWFPRPVRATLTAGGVPPWVEEAASMLMRARKPKEMLALV
jgi:hypothetical protein